MRVHGSTSIFQHSWWNKIGGKSRKAEKQRGTCRSVQAAHIHIVVSICRPHAFQLLCHERERMVMCFLKCVCEIHSGVPSHISLSLSLLSFLFLLFLSALISLSFLSLSSLSASSLNATRGVAIADLKEMPRYLDPHGVSNPQVPCAVLVLLLGLYMTFLCSPFSTSQFRHLTGHQLR